MLRHPPLDCAAVYMYGDGQGEVLNIQLVSPRHLTGEADHYVIVDFTGWRYFELLEPEGERQSDHGGAPPGTGRGFVGLVVADLLQPGVTFD